MLLEACQYKYHDHHVLEYQLYDINKHKNRLHKSIQIENRFTPDNEVVIRHPSFVSYLHGRGSFEDQAPSNYYVRTMGFCADWNIHSVSRSVGNEFWHWKPVQHCQLFEWIKLVLVNFMVLVRRPGSSQVLRKCCCQHACGTSFRSIVATKRMEMEVCGLITMTGHTI